MKTSGWEVKAMFGGIEFDWSSRLLTNAYINKSSIDVELKENW
jgi:hypothetical protein